MHMTLLTVGLFGKSLIDEKDILTSGGQYGDWALLGFISVVILVGTHSFARLHPSKIK
jgi:hypothetical protein